MLHRNTEWLTDYWRARKGDALAPARAAIDPMDFGWALPQVFIIGREAPGLYPMRLTGGFVADLHGRDLRGENMSLLWSGEHRRALATRLELAREHGEPIVLAVTAQNEGGELALQVLFAPLLGPSGDPDRFLGLYQPLEFVQRLGGRPVKTLQLLGPVSLTAEPPKLRLAAVDGQRIG